jgi:hypothetical protein
VQPDALVLYRLEDGRVADQRAVEDWTAILQEVAAFRPSWLAHG